MADVGCKMVNFARRLQLNACSSIILLVVTNVGAAAAPKCMANMSDKALGDLQATNSTRNRSLHPRQCIENSAVERSYEPETKCPYEDEKCVFAMYCVFSGGFRGDHCADSFLYTCCSKPGHGVRRAFSTSPTFDLLGALRSGDRQWTSIGAPVIEQRITRRGFKDSAVCGRTSTNKFLRKRIIGGDDAESGEFPWQAHIKIGRQQCGGALVSYNFVLTAAHCVHVKPLRLISVVLGAIEIPAWHQAKTTENQTYRVIQKKLHPNFEFSRSQPDRFDVALLRLDRRIQYRANISPICLPPRGRTFEGRRATVTGWGKTDASHRDRYGTKVLQKVQVPIITRQECERWHQLRGIDIKIHSEMMCAGYREGKRDACVGDSGGPLTLLLNDRWTIVGITSAGFGCAQSHQPGIYHLVSQSVNWILENI